MTTVQYQIQSAQVQVGCRAFAEFYVSPCGIIDAPRLAQFVGRNTGHGLVQEGFNLEFGFIRQFCALTRKELNAVIVKRVMRGTDDNPGLSAECPRQVGDTRCRNGTEQTDINPRCRKAGFKRRLKHIP